MSEAPATLVIGKITGVHGVQGWLKVMPYTQAASNAVDYQPWLIEGKPESVLEYRVNGKGLLVKLKDLDDREVAKTYVGKMVNIAKTSLPVLKDEFYWSDLIGVSVVNVTGQELGKVVDMMETGANDVLIVKGAGKTEIAIPYRLGDVIKNVDLTQGVITVEWDDEV